MDPRIKALLESDHEAFKPFLDETLSLLKMSKDYMHSHHAEWDAADTAFRMDRQADEKDKKASARREPKKVTLPFAYSQVLAFVAFCMTLYNQRPTFYSFTGTGPEDNGTAEQDAQKVVQKDLKNSKWNAVLYQLLLDVARFGLCVAKTSWATDSAMVTREQTAPAGLTLMGAPTAPETTTVTEEAVVSEGTKIIHVSPYHFFPDTRLPITRFQEGEFCACEDMYSMTAMKRLKADGVIVFNASDLPTPPQDWLDRSRFKVAPGESTQNNGGSIRERIGAATPSTVVISESQRWLVPAETMIGGEPLGESTRPELYLVWIANWSRLVRLEPMNYPHDMFTYDVGQFSHDEHRLVNEGLAELVVPMQDIASWLLNSRVAAVRKMIDSRLVVDPTKLEEQDLINRSPVIRTKPGVMGTLDMFVKQLTVSDTTQNHMSVDIPAVWGFVQTLTGTNENSTGQFSTGRRDAAQARAANAGAASRNKTVATVLWEVFFEPLGQKVIMNAQGSMSLEEFQRRVGDDADEARFLAFNKRDKGIRNNYDFVVFDGTLPSEKGFIAQSMQELLLGLFENPAAGMLLQDPTFRKLLMEICELRSIPNPQRLLPPLAQPTNLTVLPGPPGDTAPAAQPGAAGGVPV